MRHVFSDPRHIVAGLLFSSMTLCASVSKADNPIVQTNYTADPAPLLHDGRIYLYTGHDEDTLVDDFFTMNEWRVYSSADVVNWTDHGSPLRYSDFSWSRGDAWAGQAIGRNDKFYLYVPTTSASLGRMTIGVGISDSPIGPFRDAIGAPLVTENCGDIDPTVFIDEDGQAYLYWGNPNLCYVRLNADMISYQGSVVHVPMTTASFGTRSDTERPTTYEEGPWFYERNDLYYMVFAAGPLSEHIGYSTSSAPTGPWAYRGVVMPTQGASFTNHPGVIDFMGNSYFFYHNGALPGGGGFHRSVAVERFSYAADGAIPTINMTTAGAPQVGTLNPYVQTEAETIAWESGVETERCGEGGMNVTAISNGDYVKLEGVDFRTGAISFDARVAATASGGSIEVRLDGQNGMLVGTCSVPSTGGAQTWMTTTCTVNGATGTHDLYLKFTGGTGAALFNFNWWKFTARDPIGGAGGMGGAGAAGMPNAGMGGVMAGAAGVMAGAAGMVGGSGGGMAGQPGGNGGTPASGGTGQIGGTSGRASSGGGGSSASGAGPTAGSPSAGESGSAPPSGCGCRTISRGRDVTLALWLSALAGLCRRRRPVSRRR